jgi:hypothetical protein
VRSAHLVGADGDAHAAAANRDAAQSPAAIDRRLRIDGRSREGGGPYWRPCARVQSFQVA